MAQLEGAQILERFIRSSRCAGSKSDQGGQKGKNADHDSLIVKNICSQIAARPGSGKDIPSRAGDRVALRSQVTGRYERPI
ncbi:hypothetical protein MACH18_02360 [Phaeobacter italicus]|nr:hypothetical protein MACH18_02360 [Phaeobacter italicus]